MTKFAFVKGIRNEKNESLKKPNNDLENNIKKIEVI